MKFKQLHTEMPTATKQTNTMEDPQNRRRHPRYKIREGVYAGGSPHMGQILDLSQGGLAFTYMSLPDGQAKENSFVICGDDGCCLEGLPCKILSDTQLPNQSSFSDFVARKRRISFLDLSDEQLILLDMFISNYGFIEN